MLAFQGLLVSSFQMVALDEPLCKYAGFAVLAVPTWTVIFVTYILVLFVRPSSSRRLVRWDTENGEWIICKGASETEGSTGDNTNARATGHMERRHRSGSNSRRLSAVQARKSLVGGIALTVAELYSARRGSLVGEAAEASLPDVAIAIPTESSAVTRPIPILARSLSRRMYRSVKDSLSGDLLGRYAHFFERYVSDRGAWLSLSLLLLQQYVMAAFLGLAVPSGGCGYEQVSPFALNHQIRRTCPIGTSPTVLQVGVVACLCTRWLLLVVMRPHGDAVEFVYECMSVTGEALIVIMICLNYFNAARVPGSAMLICMALVVLGNLGAQVGRVALR
jgi:hypothetical protein